MPIVAGKNTRVVLREDNTLFIMTSDQEYELKEGERELGRYFRRLDIHFAIDEIVHAHADIVVSVPSVSFIIKEDSYKLFAELPEYKWKSKRIARIEFRDGDVWRDKE